MLQMIMKNITVFWGAYAGKGSMIAGIVFLLVILFEALYVKVNKEQWKLNFRILKNAVVSALLAMYVYIVIAITILSRSKETVSYVNLRLFSTFNKSISAQMYIYENILLFVPLGILLFMLTQSFRRFWLSLVTGVVCSLVIEICQWITQTGRVEVDDILTNTIGMICGFTVARVVCRLYEKYREMKERKTKW